jgi:hypothetical protein
VALELYNQKCWYPDNVLAVTIPYQVFPNNNNVYAPLFADAAGTIPLPNPGMTDAGGFVTFYAAAGSYWLHLDTETFEIALPATSGGPFLSLSGGHVTGNLQLTTGGIDVDVAQALSVGLSTGLVSGALMTVGPGPTQFNVSAGVGYIVDYATVPSAPTVVKVTIPAQTVTLAGPELARVTSWWVVNALGVISSLPAQPTDDQRRTSIQLGITGLIAGTLVNIISAPNYLPQLANHFYDHAYSLGPHVTNAAPPKVTANGANLRFNLSAGKIFTVGYSYGIDVKDPSIINTLAENPCPFFYGTQLPSSEFPATLIDVANYDVGGVITPIPGGINTTTIHRVWLFGTKIAGQQILVQYGQITYGTLAAGIAGVGSGDYVVNPDVINGGGTLIAYIIATRGCTSLQDPTTCAVRQAPRFAVP